MRTAHAARLTSVSTLPTVLRIGMVTTGGVVMVPENSMTLPLV